MTNDMDQQNYLADMSSLDWLAGAIVWIAKENDGPDLSASILRMHGLKDHQTQLWQLLAMCIARHLTLRTRQPTSLIAGYFGRRLITDTDKAVHLVARQLDGDKEAIAWVGRIIAMGSRLIAADLPEAGSVKFRQIYDDTPGAKPADGITPIEHASEDQEDLVRFSTAVSTARWHAALRAEVADGAMPSFGRDGKAAPATYDPNIPLAEALKVKRWPSLSAWLTTHGIENTATLAAQPVFSDLDIRKRTLDLWVSDQAPLHVAAMIEAAVSRLTSLPLPPHAGRRRLTNHRSVGLDP